MGKTDWKPINQVWIPYGAKMAEGDFEGNTGVAALTNKSVQLAHVFPNPAKNRINLEKLNNSAESMTTEIRSIAGVLLKTRTFNNPKQSIEIGDLTHGVYLMTISSDKSIQTERIIKQ